MSMNGIPPRRDEIPAELQLYVKELVAEAMKEIMLEVRTSISPINDDIKSNRSRIETMEKKGLKSEGVWDFVKFLIPLAAGALGGKLIHL